MSYRLNRPLKSRTIKRRLPIQDPVEQVAHRFTVPADHDVRIRVYGNRGTGIHMPRFTFDVSRRFRGFEYEKLLSGDQRGPNNQAVPEVSERTEWRIRFRQKNSIFRRGGNDTDFTGDGVASLKYLFRGPRFIVVECTWRKKPS